MIYYEHYIKKTFQKQYFVQFSAEYMLEFLYVFHFLFMFIYIIFSLFILHILCLYTSYFRYFCISSLLVLKVTVFDVKYLKIFVIVHYTFFLNKTFRNVFFFLNYAKCSSGYLKNV